MWDPWGRKQAQALWELSQEEDRSKGLTWVRWEGRKPGGGCSIPTINYKGRQLAKCPTCSSDHRGTEAAVTLGKHC